MLSLEDRITIDATSVPTTSNGTSVPTPIDGAFDGLTVGLVPLDLGDVVRHYLGHDPSKIVTADEIRPPDIDASTYHTLEKAAYVDGGQVAAAVAERALGYLVTDDVDRLQIIDVAAGTAADGVLHTGERVTAADGSALTSQDDLVRAVHAAAAVRSISRWSTAGRRAT